MASQTLYKSTKTQYMTYYILKGFEKTGPYTREDILAMFEAHEVDDKTSVMHSGLLRWFPLNKLEDVFIKGEDEAYFKPALFCSNPPPPVLRRNGPLPRPNVPITQREEDEESQVSGYKFHNSSWLESNGSKCLNSFSVSSSCIGVFSNG